MNSYLVADTHGTTRRGPFGAWWAWLTPAAHDDGPAARARVWNVAAVLFAASDLYAAHRFGILGVILPVLAGMVTAAGAALVWIGLRNAPRVTGRYDEAAAERDAARAGIEACRPRPTVEPGQVAA